MPALVQSAASGHASRATFALPAAPTAGNLLVLILETTNGSNSPPPLTSGWTRLHRVDVGSFRSKFWWLEVWTRVAQAGDGASWSLLHPGPTNVDAAYWIGEWSGADVGPFAYGLTSTDPTANALTVAVSPTTTGGPVVVLAGAVSIDNDTPPVTGLTWTGDLTEQVEQAAFDAAGGNGEGRMGVAWVIDPTANASYSTTVTGTGAYSPGETARTYMISVVLAQPAVTAPGVYEIIPPGTSISLVGTLTEAFNEAIRPVRNAPGSGQLSINRYSAEATATAIKPGNLVKVTYPEIDPNPIFAWFMEKGDFQLVSSNEQGGEDITITGRGAMSYWDRAVWLAEPFVIPWWDAAWGTPPVGARGHVTFIAGAYRRYTIAGGVITGYTNFTTAGFEAYFDTRQTYEWPSASSKRFLVKLMAGETNAGWYVHPHQAGVTETLPSYAVGTSTSVLLSDISADKPGAILHHLFLEGQSASRPTQPIPLMTIDFTATLDSNGVAWSTTSALAGLTAELGETYLDTIAKLVSTGVIDVRMGPNLDMHAYNAYGTVRTSTTFAANKVRFVKGVNIADELGREVADNPVATFIEVVGTDNVTGRASLPDAATRVARETSATGDSADATVLAALGLALLNQRLVRSDAIGLRIATGTTELTGLYRPGPSGTTNGKFWLGDTITLHTGTGEQDYNQSAQRVHAITIERDEAGNLEVTPEVGSVLGEQERALFARETGKSTPFAPRSVTTDTEVAEVPIAGDFVTTTAGGGEVLSTIAASGATETIDLATANVHDITLTANCTFTFAAVSSGRARSFTLLLRQDATGSRLATWPASVVWPGGTTPTLATGAWAVDVFAFFTLDGGTIWYGFPTGGSSAITVKDEGGALATAATSLDFVGAGVVASGAGAAKTITIAGAPSGAAGGDLSGTYPNPSVVDDSHAHTAATVPAATGDHEHIVGETFSGNAVTTAFEIANEPIELEAVAAYVAGVRTAVTVSGDMNTTVTFAAAPASGTDNIVIDYPAVAA